MRPAIKAAGTGIADASTVSGAADPSESNTKDKS
jgi:hypothetical protein